MSKINTAISLWKKDHLSILQPLFEVLNKKKMLNFLSDKSFLKVAFRLRMGKKLNLSNPKTFNEKLQWLKIYGYKSEYQRYVDKAEVKGYITELLGKEYVVKTYGIWDKPENIDWDILPQKFILKTTHGSGGFDIVICKDKSSLDRKKAIQILNQGIKRNSFSYGRERPYKNLTPRILAEELLEDPNSKNLKDYKFFCFNGEPKFLYVSSDLDNHEKARISYVGLDWKKEPFCRTDYKPMTELPEKPSNLDAMIDIARTLSKDFPFVRVDLYSISDMVKFSELTLYTGSGFTKFEPEEWDIKIGQMLILPID